MIDNNLQRHLADGSRTNGVTDPARFATETKLQQWCDHVGRAGLRNTASDAHEDTIRWIANQLRQFPDVTLRVDSFEVDRWQPLPDANLESAGALWMVRGSAAHGVPVAGAVPYSLPTDPQGYSGDMVYLPPGAPITAENAGGKVVIRDFPHTPVPYGALLADASHVTSDLLSSRGHLYDRPAFADDIIHADLVQAGSVGAAGMVVAFDLPRDQVAGYFEPHKGTHYALPAVFIGSEERDEVLELASKGTQARIAVTAQVGPARTRNLFATLPGKSSERIVLVTHTDGNTWVQDNGIAALLALAHYFSGLPFEDRERTIEFAFTSAHLHISREGSASYAEQLDHEYDEGKLAFVFAVEHLGTREAVPVAQENGQGRRLIFTGAGEPLLWAIGPSPELARAVTSAVVNRNLDKVAVTSGIGVPDPDRVPAFGSFGGIGSYFHCRLVPTTAIISGPWTLWAPSFRSDAIDVARLRSQTLAIADVIHELGRVPTEDIAGGYASDRLARAQGAKTWPIQRPPESVAAPLALTEPSPTDTD